MLLTACLYAGLAYGGCQLDGKGKVLSKVIKNCEQVMWHLRRATAVGVCTPHFDSARAVCWMLPTRPGFQMPLFLFVACLLELWVQLTEAYCLLFACFSVGVYEKLLSMGSLVRSPKGPSPFGKRNKCHRARSAGALPLLNVWRATEGPTESEPWPCFFSNLHVCKQVML